MKSTLNLFKALPVTTKDKKKPTKELLKKTIKYGFIFSPEVVANYSESTLLELIKEIGLSSEQMNNAFHKSWVKVKKASIEQLVIEQIVHYITTYGYERLGIYSEDTVYIPEEKLDIPKIDKKKFPLVIIKGYTMEELKNKLLNILNSGIALAEDTKNDIIDIATFVELTEEEVFAIKNKETKIALFEYFDLIPKEPIEFLRYALYKSIDQTLLIKNLETIDEIKSKKNLSVLKVFEKYEKMIGLQRLAEIFYRFKPIFLAFRTNKKLKMIINRIRRLAVKYHKPMKEDYLNSITSKITNGEVIDTKTLKDELSKVNNFRKIRLAYALNFRKTETKSIMYRIRNGKSYATEFDPKNTAETRRVLKVVLKSIVEEVGKNLKGKRVKLPKNITYALPSSEKMFSGNFPLGTYVSIPKDMIFGVHWKNMDRYRVDLDLSLISLEHGKIGWDADYRSEDRDILFSGDVTDAPKPKGASELFYIKKQKRGSALLFVNYFNYSEKHPVPFDIVVAKELVKDFKNNYMINPNNIVAKTTSKAITRQKLLGLLTTTKDECRFYFIETSIGQSITSNYNDYTEHARKYLTSFYENTINLRDILEEAGVKFVTDNYDIDLSPEKLEKDTIINMLYSPERKPELVLQ